MNIHHRRRDRHRPANGAFAQSGAAGPRAACSCGWPRATQGFSRVFADLRSVCGSVAPMVEV